MPTLTAERDLCLETKAIEIQKLESKLRTANSIIDSAEEPMPGWLLPTVAMGSFITGTILSLVLVGNL